MVAVIETRGLTKSYGPRRGIVDVNLTVPGGEVFGFLGPNGAGKTTTIRLLLDLIRPTSGSATVLGRDPRHGGVRLRREIGYLAGEPGLDDRLTGEQLLTWFGHLRGAPDLGYARELAERLELDLSRQIKALSHGNRQKVGIVQALMHRPRLAILDEPTGGLDPLIQQEFLALLREARAAGQSIFLSSHVLAEVERVADRVAIIREGRVVVVETIAELKASAPRRLELHFAQPVDSSDFARLPAVRAATNLDTTIVQLAVDGLVDDVVKMASRFTTTNIISREPDLEEIFLAYYAGPDAAGTEDGGTPGGTDAAA